MSDVTIETRVTRLEAVFDTLPKIDDKLDKLGVKLDSVIRLEQTQQEHSSSFKRAFEAISATDKRMDDTREKFTAWTNEADGRRKTWGLVLSVTQVIVLAVIGWQFKMTMENHDAVKALEGQVKYHVEHYREQR